MTLRVKGQIIEKKTAEESQLNETKSIHWAKQSSSHGKAFVAKNISQPAIRLIRGGRALNVGQAGHAQGVVVDGICCGYVVNGWMGALTAKALSVGNSDKVTTYGFKVSG